MLSKLTKSHRIIGPSAGASLLCFFLPWVLVSCEGQPVASFSGFQLAFGGQINSPAGVIPLNASPDLLLVLLGIVAILGMIVLVYQGRMIAARTTRFITGIVGLNLVILLWRMLTAGSSASSQGGPTVEVSLQLGYWITLLAHGAMGYALWQEWRGAKTPAVAPVAPIDPPLASESPPTPALATGETAVATPQTVLVGAPTTVLQTDEQKCSSCGTANPPDTRFCMNCGAKLSDA
jgi:hypothetical protein